MSTTLSKVIICFSFSVTALIGTLLLVFLLRIPRCELIGGVPANLSQEDLKNMVACDYDAIANIDAYLIYAGEDGNQYLPLKLESLCRETIGGEQQIGMEMNCSKITMRLYENQVETIKLMQVDTITVDLMIPFGHTTSCQVKNPPVIQYEVGTHYFCDKQITLDCLFDLTDKLAPRGKVQLVFNRLEFEINGNQTMYKTGEFSTTKFQCVDKKDESKLKVSNMSGTTVL